MNWNAIKCKFWIPNFLFLVTSVLFSIFIYYIFVKYRTSVKKLHHNLPENHYLQVRDEFPVLLNYIKDEFFVEPEKRYKNEDQNEASVQEALGSLSMAMEMELQGKDSKAFRLYKHAIALAPKHPEILTKYGEYLEHHQNDVVQADQYYFQALSFNPLHSQALANRQRTESIVENIDRDRLNLLEQKRAAFAEIHESNSALRRAKKEAYAQHIYHSVGIEGNTMSFAQTKSILETRMAVEGKSIDEHNEILGLDAAMKFINASLVNKNDYITLRDILQIHRRVLGHVDPIEGGEFRRTQVYVGGHIPPGPGDLSILMQHFENWLNSDNALTMHPVKYAALAHYKLVHIHPFIDGNGRTSRLLMNTILMRSGYPPIIIPKQLRHNYYSYLQMANEGDIRPFIRFVAECTEKTLDLYLWATSDLIQQIPMLSQAESDVDVESSTDDFNDEGEGSTIRLHN